MSAATEIAEREAAAAEAEDETGDGEAPNDDTNTDQDDEGEGGEGAAPEPEAVSPVVSDADAAKLKGKLDSENKRHRAALVKLTELPEEMLSPCPLCDEWGHVLPPEVAQYDAHDYAAVQAQLGYDPEPELEQDPNSKRCERCKGKGKLKTGAETDRGKAIACGACQGMGYVSSVAPVPVPAISLTPVAPLPAPPAPAVAGAPPPPQPVYNPTTGQWELPQ